MTNQMFSSSCCISKATDSFLKRWGKTQDTDSLRIIIHFCVIHVCSPLAETAPTEEILFTYLTHTLYLARKVLPILYRARKVLPAHV